MSEPCCKWHQDGCWYDACCTQCPERERCRARLGEARCTLPVSQHRVPRSLDIADHHWTAPKEQADD